MAIERTFSIIKPDATARNLTGAVNAVIEKAGLRIVAQKRIRMTKEQAETFYAVHKARPFFGELVEFMTSGPVVVQVLEGEGAVAKDRDALRAPGWSRGGKPRGPAPSTATRWDRPIRPSGPTAPSASYTQSRSARTPRTVRMRGRPPRSRSRSSSRATRSSADQSADKLTGR